MQYTANPSKPLVFPFLYFLSNCILIMLGNLSPYDILWSIISSQLFGEFKMKIVHTLSYIKTMRILAQLITGNLDLITAVFSCNPATVGKHFLSYAFVSV